jgi:hypothetical protein
MNDSNGWHVKKEVSVGRIFTTMTVAVSVVAMFYKIDSQVNILEYHQDTLSRQNLRTEQRFEKALDELKDQIGSSFDRLELKLEGKADK